MKHQEKDDIIILIEAQTMYIILIETLTIHTGMDIVMRHQKKSTIPSLTK